MILQCCVNAAVPEREAMSRIGRAIASALCSMTAVATQGIGCAAQAQAYPNRAIRMIVPFAAGGIADLIARQVSAQGIKDTGQSIVVENRGGAGGNIGLDVVA